MPTRGLSDNLLRRNLPITTLNGVGVYFEISLQDIPWIESPGRECVALLNVSAVY